MHAGRRIREGEQADAGGDKPRPGGERHARERHAFGAQVESGGDEIQRAEQLADAEERNGRPPRDFVPWLRRGRHPADGAKRGVGGPAGERRAVGDEESGHENEEGDESGPERHHVEAREGHVFRADLEWEENNFRSRRRERW